MMKTLGHLVSALPKYELSGDGLETKITSVVDDSRKCTQGSLFVAIKGAHVDAHEKISEAIDLGACAIVGERPPEKVKLTVGTPYIKVPNSREALSYLASSWFNFPTRKLKVIGVTGTDGKTTTTKMIQHIFEKSRLKTGLINTISAKIGKKEYDTGFHVSNPEPLALYKFLAQMVKKHCKYVVLEVTSHGIDQKRVAAIDFEAAVLTNVAREHLDYHKTFEVYRRTKAQLFENVPIAVVNKDDKSFDYFVAKVKKEAKVVSYAVEDKKADFYATEIKAWHNGMAYKLNHSTKKYDVRLKNVIGDYNVLNSLAAISTAASFGIDLERVVRSLADFTLPTGRLEKVKNSRGINIFIDFAHTPQGLQNVLSVLRKRTKGRLIVVTGCDGERDKTKRPLMGKIAGSIADISILSETDPRSEKVKDILSAMAKGARESGAKFIESKRIPLTTDHVFFEIQDRAEAIYFVLNNLAKEGDTVVLCGKGHERGMDYGTHEAPWSDHEVVKLALAGKVYTRHKWEILQRRDTSTLLE